MVNLAEAQVEVHCDLRDGKFTRTEILRRGQHVRPAPFPDIGFDVSSLVGHEDE